MNEIKNRQINKKSLSLSDEYSNGNEKFIFLNVFKIFYLLSENWINLNEIKKENKNEQLNDDFKESKKFLSIIIVFFFSELFLGFPLATEICSHLLVDENEDIYFKENFPLTVKYTLLIYKK